MNIVKLFKDFEFVHNHFNYINSKLDVEPVVYYADYKAQRVKAIFNSFLMISKFDHTIKDYVRFCDINFQNDSLVSVINNSGDWIVICIDGENTHFERILNYTGKINIDTNTDEYFNITVGYDIPFSYDELMQVLNIAKNLTHRAWIYYS